jgi:branched-chain amino acid transport system permease protein
MSSARAKEVNYQKETAIIRTKAQWIFVTGLLVFLLLCPPFVSQYTVSVCNNIAITIIACLGVQIVLGYCGQINIGQAAFMAVGAYSWALLCLKLGFSVWLAIPVAGIITCLVGMLFSLPAVRVKGFYLLLTTLTAHLLIIWIIASLEPLTGGVVNGLHAPTVSIGKVILRTDLQAWYVVMPVLMVMIFITINITRSRIGRAFVAIRDNESAASVMGINPFTCKVLAFGISTFYAGIAGSMWGITSQYLHPDQFDIMQGIWYLAIITVGGMGSIGGVVVGAIVMGVLRESIMWITPVVKNIAPSIGETVYAGATYIFFGLIIILFLLFEPRGLWHRLEALGATISRYRSDDRVVESNTNIYKGGGR